MQWGGMAWDPVTRTIIAPVNRIPSIVRLVPSADFARTRRTNPGLEITEQRGTPFAMSRQFFLSPSGVPCVAPPWESSSPFTPTRERRRGGRRWETCARRSSSLLCHRPGPSISAARSPPPLDSSSSARRLIRISELSRRKTVARRGRPSYLQAREPRRSCSRRRVGVRWLRSRPVASIRRYQSSGPTLVVFALRQ